jgi:hypothetical protein
VALALLLLPQRDHEFRGDTACRSGRRGLRRWGRRHCGDAQDLDRRLGGYRRRETSLGSILVNSTGRTLYLFKADVGTKSGCSGACATAWPPLLGSGKPTAATGPTASKLATITRSDGSQQVTDNGHRSTSSSRTKSPVKPPARA